MPFLFRKIMLDIAIPQNTGHPAKYSEQCLCPQGYEGLSCEACARGYYRQGILNYQVS